MSIPERLSRIVRYKFSELKDKFDQLDEAALADPAEAERLRRAQARVDARRELEDTLSTDTIGSPSHLPPVTQAPPVTRNPQMRSPQDIVRSATTAATGQPVQSSDSSSLNFHYRVLGLQPGDDWATVQSAYEALKARTLPGRFPEGSDEAAEVEDIRSRLEASYRALREALDATASRFGLLEFDSAPRRETSE